MRELGDWGVGGDGKGRGWEGGGGGEVAGVVGGKGGGVSRGYCCRPTADVKAARTVSRLHMAPTPLSPHTRIFTWKISSFEDQERKKLFWSLMKQLSRIVLKILPLKLFLQILFPPRNATVTETPNFGG